MRNRGIFTETLYRKIFFLSTENGTIFVPEAYTGRKVFWGGGNMWDDDNAQDLDDLIFEKEDGGPSER